MALADTPFRVTVRGTWPDPITLRRGWSRAEARRWNDATRAAHLRLVRGGAPFLRACVELIHSLGGSEVLSPPLPASARATWLEAGFEPHIDLALMRLSLHEAPASPNHLVVETEPDILDRLLAIDQAAFSEFWRFDGPGMREAFEATANAKLLIIRGAEGDPVAFAIVGFGHAIAYLQRVAVHPDWQGQGMGRSLVRVSARMARATGARAMLLNTQFDNEPAIRLYRSEGFTVLPDPLALLRAAR